MPSVDLTFENDITGSERMDQNYLIERRPDRHQPVVQETTNDMSNQNHVCKICHKRYGTEDDLRNHKLHSHQQEPKIGVRCSVCGKKYADMRQFQAHSANGHRLKCHVYLCSARFATDQDLRRHMRVEHNVVGPMPEVMEAEKMLQHKYSCKKCERKYVLEADLKHHMALRHKKEQSTEARTSGIFGESSEKPVRVMSKNRIYVQGLPKENITLEEIAKVFRSVGPLKREQRNEVYMYYHKNSTKFTGNCTVTYEVASDASKAVSVFNGKKMFEGGRITVEMAMVPLHTKQTRDGARDLTQRPGSIPEVQTSPRRGANRNPNQPLPPHLSALCHENRCDLCDVRFVANNSRGHYLGRKHRERVEEVLGLNTFQPHPGRRGRAFRPY